MTPVPLAELNAMDKARFVAALGGIYDISPWVVEAVSAQRPFASLAALHEAMSLAVQKTSDTYQRALIDAHPDLAGKAARAGTMTADSEREQSSAGLDRLNQADFDALQRLNGAYREKFGFPFIICVRRHSKDSILRQFELRLRNDGARERDTALGEIVRIAALRLDQRVVAGLGNYAAGVGHLTVGFACATGGRPAALYRPAAGVGFELHELSSTGEARLVANGSTNVEGRTDAPLIGGRPIPIGRYELRFAIGSYFSGMKVALVDPPFLDVIPVRFGIAEPEGHYHVPLVATPWSYSTYRGS